MKTFTDSDGKTWEEVENTTQVTNHKLIRPVQEAKKRFMLYFQPMDGEPELVNEYYSFTQPQAEAVAKSLKSLMEYIQGGGTFKGLDYEYISLAMKARAALQEPTDGN